MALLSVRGGTVGTINDASQWCVDNHCCLTLTVFSPSADVRYINSNVVVFVQGGAAEGYPVTTDGRGRISLIFTSGDDLAAVTVRVRRADPTIEAQAAVAATVDGTFWQANVALLPTYKLVLRVVDMRPAGVAGAPIPLEHAELVVSGIADPLEMTVDGSVTRPAMMCGTAITVRPPTALEPVLALSKVARRVDEGEWVLPAAEAVAGGVTHSVSDALVVSVNCTRPGATVEIEFRLKFRCVFIVGEGERFDYAIQLSKKYQGPTPNDARAPTRHDVDAPETALLPARRWIIASQYDRTDPAGIPAVAAQRNLHVYRHGGADPGFDTTSEACWNALNLLFTERFDATVFNNPHPGYGIHQCTNKNLSPDNQDQGQYVNVHTLGCGARINQVNAQSYFGEATRRTAAFQRQFVRTDAQDWYLNYQCVFDTAQVPNFEGPALPVAEAFQYRPAEGGGDLVQAQFNGEAVHYRPRAATRGLYEHIIFEYRRLAQTALKPGGWVYMNGSAALARSAVERGAAGNMLTDQGSWPTHGELYANYPSNFTHPTVHPSWLAVWNNWPREPNIGNGRAFGRQF